MQTCHSLITLLPNEIIDHIFDAMLENYKQSLGYETPVLMNLSPVCYQWSIIVRIKRFKSLVINLNDERIVKLAQYVDWCIENNLHLHNFGAFVRNVMLINDEPLSNLNDKRCKDTKCNPLSLQHT